MKLFIPHLISHCLWALHSHREHHFTKRKRERSGIRDWMCETWRSEIGRGKGFFERTRKRTKWEAEDKGLQPKHKLLSSVSALYFSSKVSTSTDALIASNICPGLPHDTGFKTHPQAHLFSLKGIGHTKTNTPSSFTHPHVIPNLHDLLSSAEHKRRLKNVCTQLLASCSVWTTKKCIYQNMFLCSAEKESQTGFDWMM